MAGENLNNILPYRLKYLIIRRFRRVVSPDGFDRGLENAVRRLGQRRVFITRETGKAGTRCF